MNPQVAGLAVSVPIVIGLSKLIEVFWTDPKWQPIICVLCGVGANLVLAYFFVEPLTREVVGNALVDGVAGGLAASGLYSGAATYFKALRTRNTNVPPSPLA